MAVNGKVGVSANQDMLGPVSLGVRQVIFGHEDLHLIALPSPLVSGPEKCRLLASCQRRALPKAFQVVLALQACNTWSGRHSGGETTGYAC